MFKKPAASPKSKAKKAKPAPPSSQPDIESTPPNLPLAGSDADKVKAREAAIVIEIAALEAEYRALRQLRLIGGKQ